MDWVKIENGIVPDIKNTFLVYVPDFVEPCRKVHKTQAGIFDAFECGCGQKVENATHYCLITEPEIK